MPNKQPTFEVCLVFEVTKTYVVRAEDEEAARDEAIARCERFINGTSFKQQGLSTGYISVYYSHMKR